MSSIAYVADEEMLEYHRLSLNRTMLFWRLTDKKKFTDFHKGDLLFFYARPHRSKKKGLVGYAHYDAVKRLTLDSMWNKYGEKTGYSSRERLADAIRKASKGDIPKRMNCLYLTDVVFFLYPVYPEEIQMEIPAKLESYFYLDHENPKATLKILERAQKHGLDLWSSDPNVSPDDIFRADMIRHQIASVYKDFGKETGSEKEKTLARKLAWEKVKEKNWEYIRESRTDCVRITSGRITIAVPFVTQVNDKEQRVRELIGRLVIYKSDLQKMFPEKKVIFEVMSETENEQIKGLVREINNV